MMEPARKRILLRRIRIWSLIIVPLVSLGFVGVREFSTTSPKRIGSGGMFGSNVAVGEAISGEFDLTSIRWGPGTHWKYDTRMTLREVIATEVDGDRVQRFEDTRYDIIAIPRPFTLKLREQGTVMETERVFAMDDPLFENLSIGWSDDGLLIDPTGDGAPFYAPGTRYDLGGMISLAGQVVVQSLLLSVVVCFAIGLLTAEQIWVRLQPWQCHECGYDLRGNPENEPGCPECGWGRQMIDQECAR